jgi:hypothetical protein
LIASFGFNGKTNVTKMQTTRDKPFNCKHPRNTECQANQTSECASSFGA